MHKLILFALLSALLVACGQKGPLYLPQDADTADADADVEQRQREQ